MAQIDVRFRDLPRVRRIGTGIGVSQISLTLGMVDKLSLPSIITGLMIGVFLTAICVLYPIPVQDRLQ